MSSIIDSASSPSNSVNGDEDTVCKNAVEQEEISCDKKASLLGHYVTKEYGLLRLVLSHLGIRDLNAAAQVCRTWASAADVIRHSRAKLQWLLWTHSRKGLNSWEFPRKLFTEHFYSEPQLCLFFMTQCIFGSSVNCSKTKISCPNTQDGKKCGLSTHRVVDFIRAEVQPDCPCVVVQSCGVVGTLHDMSKTLEVEEGNNGYSGVLLPRLPGLTVTYFQLDTTHCKKLQKDCLTDDEMKKFLGLTPSSPPIRCLLLFCRNMNSRAMSHLVMSLQNRQEDGIAIGGGYFDSLNISNVPFPSTQKRRMALFGIVLSGENIMAASTILDSEVVDKDQVDEAMDELQACNLPAKDSVAFMFACMGRGKHWYNSCNVESESFRRHFPSTPLVGYFGNGEVGLKYFPDSPCKPSSPTQSGPSPKKIARLQRPKLLHSYTSIFVYLSLRGQHSS